MMGLITIKNNQYLFRNDHGFGEEYWAWNIHGDNKRDQLMTHKWKKLPSGSVELFNLENPPQTVSYNPWLN